MFAAALVLVGIRVVATIRVSAVEGLFVSVQSAATALLQFAPLCLCLPGALSAARDNEAGMERQLAPAGVPRSWFAQQQVAVAVSLAGGVTIVALLAAAASGLLIRGAGFRPEGWSSAVTALVCVLPVWAAWGLAAARLGRTRPIVPIVVLAFWLLVLVIERLAAAVPIVRWLNLVSPIGLADFLISGTHLTSLPGHIPTLVARIVPVLALALPLVIAVPARRDRDGAGTRRKRRELSSRSAAVATFVASCLAFGYVAPTAVASVIPWRLSPTWLIDEATGTLPDAPVRRFFAALQQGDTRTADELTLVGDHVRTLGVLRGALQPPPPDLQIAIDRRAAVAGTLRVRWTAAGEGHEVLACTAREPRGWKLAVFSSGPSCPSSL